MAARPCHVPSMALVPQLRAISAPIVLVWAGVEHELITGSALVGRHPDCEIVVDNPLVSRMHARVKIDAGGVFVEDLHSTNGVYINGMRIVRESKLHHGDILLVSACELAFFEGRSEAAPASGLVPVGVGEADELDLSLDGVQPAPRRAKRAWPRAIPPTGRADVLNVVGSVARRAAEEGRADEALRVLAPQLRTILRGANAGLEVSDHLRSLASGYAMDLAQWTVESAWLDYVVELHLACRCLMSRATFLSLQRSERWLGPMNRALLAYYAESFVVGNADLDSDERAVLAMIAKLAEG